jgi:exportin-T
VLIKATTGSQPFDNQLYLFEAVGTLISLIWRDPSEQLRLMEAVIGPLVRDIDAGLQKPMTGGPDDALQILQIHHLIMSIGSIAKGFPDAPEILPAQPPQWIAAFEQASDGIFRALDVMKSQRIVRDAVGARFSRLFVITPLITLFSQPTSRHAARSLASSPLCQPV